MRHRNRTAARRIQRGQGMTEYIIIVALIAIAAIGVFSMFGKTVRNQAAGLAKELSGNNATQAISNAADSANAAAGRANDPSKHGMANYHKANDAK